MKISPSRTTLIALPILFLLAACEDPEPREAQADVEPAAGEAAVQVVEVGGFDYRFEAPEVIAAGWTTFRFANHGPEAHHLTLMRLAPGRTANDALAALRDRQPLTGIVTAVGGPNAPMPGASSDATLDLEPGEYVLVCVVPSPDGMPHFLKGMAKPITVRAGDGALVAAPAADVEVTLTDYTFDMGGPIAAGERTVRVLNTTSAVEPHEIVLVRLPDGVTVEHVNDWMHSMQGPPPAEFIGGITALDPGESGDFTANFTPGEYAFLCPLPSPDGEPHTNKGMLHQFRVM